MVTLSDVARLASVSVTTASMALSGNSGVAPETRRRVEEAAAQLHYVPDSAGRSLRSRRAGALAVVVPHSTRHLFSHPVLIDLLEGVMSVVNERGLLTVLSTSVTEVDAQTAYDRVSRGRRADGIIVFGSAATDVNPAQLNRAGYPVLVVGRVPLTPDVNSVGLDDLAGSFTATQHLVRVHGARRIAHLSGPLRHQSAIDKRDGYAGALREAGLTIDPRLQVEGDYSEQSGWRAAQRLLEYIDSFEAVFCANDQMAIGALQAFREAGFAGTRTPAIVGYDDHPLARFAQPPLTTVAADMVNVGREAARRLLYLLDHIDAEATHLAIPTHLVIRSSCGCAYTNETG